MIFRSFLRNFLTVRRMCVWLTGWTGLFMQSVLRRTFPSSTPGNRLRTSNPWAPGSVAVVGFLFFPLKTVHSKLKSYILQSKLVLFNYFLGIRSVSFYEHIVTVGTGQGSLLFYDIRAQRFLDGPSSTPGGYRNRTAEGILKLTTGRGWLVGVSCILKINILIRPWLIRPIYASYIWRRPLQALNK